MPEVRFEGYLVIPDTEVVPEEITPNTGEKKIELTKEESDIVIHSLYVANPNSVLTKVTLRPLLEGRKDLKFIGLFEYGTKAVTFTPPIGPFKQGKLLMSAEGDGADKNVIVNIQYSRVKEGVPYEVED